MYALFGLAFCVLLGFMIRVQGISALLWTPVGFAFGLFSGASMVLPLMLGVPRAIWLLTKRQMRMAVFGRILITPLIWLVGLFVIFFLVGFLWPSTADFISNNTALNLGTSLGWVVIILSPLSAKGRSDFVSDFDKAYHEFYVSANCSTRRAIELDHPEREYFKAESKKLEAQIDEVITSLHPELARANQIVDRIQAIAESGGFSRPVLLSKVGASSTADALAALYLVTAETFRDASLNNTPQNQALLQEYLHSAGGIAMWIVTMFTTDGRDFAGEIDESVRDSETVDSFVDFLKTIEPSARDYWKKVYARIGH